MPLQTPTGMSLERLVARNMTEPCIGRFMCTVRVSVGACAKANAVATSDNMTRRLIPTELYFLFFTIQRMNNASAAIAKANTIVQPIKP